MDWVSFIWGILYPICLESVQQVVGCVAPWISTAEPSGAADSTICESALSGNPTQLLPLFLLFPMTNTYSVISKYLLNWYHCGHSFYAWSPLFLLWKKWSIYLILLSSRQLWDRWCWPQQCLIHKWLLDDRPLLITWSDWYKIGSSLIILGIFLVINQPSQLWQNYLEKPLHVSGFGYAVHSIRASIQQFEKAYLFITSESILGSSITACLTQKKWWDTCLRK